VRFYYDVVCPYSYMETRAVEAAEDAGEAEVEWLPFELRPAPKPLLEVRGDHLRVDWTQNVYRRALDRGIEIHLPRYQPRSTLPLAAACARLGVYAVCGLLERDDDRLRNAAVFVGPDGLIGSYRKTHLPFLGVDRFTVPGDELPVYDTPLGRIGVEICYDLRFPEATRTLALKGADLIAHPTNFPVAARIQTELITVARAAENRIYLLTANRVGKERTGEFCGWSQIVDPYGKRLAEAGETGEAFLVADVDVEKARDKDYVIPGEYELYLFGDRRPELYGALVEETQAVKT